MSGNDSAVIEDWCGEKYDVNEILVEVDSVEDILRRLCNPYKRIGDVHVCVIECSAFAFRVRGDSA